MAKQKPTPRATAQSVAPPMPIPEVNTTTAKTFIAERPIVIVDFSASWCSPCCWLRERLQQELLPHLPAGVALISVDVDKNADFADEMNIEAMPTIFLFHHGRQTPILVQKKEEPFLLGAKPDTAAILKAAIARCIAKDGQNLHDAKKQLKTHDVKSDPETDGIQEVRPEEPEDEAPEDGGDKRETFICVKCKTQVTEVPNEATTGLVCDDCSCDLEFCGCCDRLISGKKKELDRGSDVWYCPDCLAKNLTICQEIGDFGCGDRFPLADMKKLRIPSGIHAGKTCLLCPDCRDAALCDLDADETDETDESA